MWRANREDDECRVGWINKLVNALGRQQRGTFLWGCDMFSWAHSKHFLKLISSPRCRFRRIKTLFGIWLAERLVLVILYWYNTSVNDVCSEFLKGLKTHTNLSRSNRLIFPGEDDRSTQTSENLSSIQVAKLLCFNWIIRNPCYPWRTHARTSWIHWFAIQPDISNVTVLEGAEKETQ